MKCPTAGCPEELDDRLATRAFERDGLTIVVEDIPAQVCDVCGYTVLDLWVLDELLKIDPETDEPVRFAPVFKFKPEKAPAIQPTN